MQLLDEFLFKSLRRSKPNVSLGISDEKSLRKWTGFKDVLQKYKNSKLFWSVFSKIWTECEHLQNKSLYSVRVGENMEQIIGNFSPSRDLLAIARISHKSVNFRKIDWSRHFSTRQELPISRISYRSYNDIIVS